MRLAPAAIRSAGAGAALIAGVTVMAIGGCANADRSGSDRPAATSTTAPRVSLSITAPQEGASVRPRVEVRGIVSPKNATVDVNGEAARVREGRFHATVVLKKGGRQIQATAVAAGVSDRAAVAVKRLPSTAEKRAAERRKAARAQQDQAANSSGSGSDGSWVMPNEVGANLQEAQDDVQRASGDPLFVSHSRDATGEGRFQILDRDWKVCGQNVPAGQRVSAVAHIVFSVVKDYEDCP